MPYSPEPEGKPVKVKMPDGSTRVFKNEKDAIRIEKTRDIELLHYVIMIRISPFLSYKVTGEMIFNSEN